MSKFQPPEYLRFAHKGNSQILHLTGKVEIQKTFNGEKIIDNGKEIISGWEYESIETNLVTKLPNIMLGKDELKNMAIKCANLEIELSIPTPTEIVMAICKRGKHDENT